jgi:hypothetical protein
LPDTLGTKGRLQSQTYKRHTSVHWLRGRAAITTIFSAWL